MMISSRSPSVFRKALCTVSFFALAAVALGGCTSKPKDSGNSITIPVEAKIKGLDPIQADDLYASDQVAMAYEGLLEYHYLKRPFVLVPALAESLPDVSADGKTITFKIKKGVLFQDDP